MDPISLFILSLILVTVVIVLVLQVKESKNSTNEVRLDELRKTFDSGLSDTKEVVNSQIKSSQDVLHKITKDMENVKQTSRQVLSFADKLMDFEKVLKNPQQRGYFGETILENIISNIFPTDGYKMQYQMKKDNLRADAVVFLQKNMKIVIDAKLSLDSYKRYLDDGDEKSLSEFRTALKSQITKVKAYISPEEDDTLNIALLFLPSEAVYYDLLTEKIGSGDAAKNFIEFAYRQKVVLVSPNTLAAYLQVIALSMENFKIEKNVDNIIREVEKLKSHSIKYEEVLDKFGKSLAALANHYDSAKSEYSKISKDIHTISDK